MKANATTSSPFKTTDTSTAFSHSWASLCFVIEGAFIL